jgi:hypothetical protein
MFEQKYSDNGRYAERSFGLAKAQKQSKGKY